MLNILLLTLMMGEDSIKNSMDSIFFALCINAFIKKHLSILFYLFVGL